MCKKNIKSPKKTIEGLCTLDSISIRVLGFTITSFALLFRNKIYLKEKKQLVQISYRLPAYTYTCVLCTHIRIDICPNLVHLDSSGPPGVGSRVPDILAGSIEILRKRIAAGTAKFLVQMKAHRGEPANEGADILADKAILDLEVGKEWYQRTNRAVFRSQRQNSEKVTYQDRHSTFNNSVRYKVRRGAAENEV